MGLKESQKCRFPPLHLFQTRGEYPNLLARQVQSWWPASLAGHFFLLQGPFAVSLKCHSHLFIYKLELKPGTGRCRDNSCAFAVFNSQVGGSAENKHEHWLVSVSEAAGLRRELRVQTRFSPHRPSKWHKKGNDLPSTNIRLFYSVGKPVRDLHCYWFWYLNNQYQSFVLLLPSWFLGVFFFFFFFKRICLS